MHLSSIFILSCSFLLYIIHTLQYQYKQPKQSIREIAKLLAETPPKEEKARIKTEALIQDDNTGEACEILALNCKLLAECVPLISHCKTCPDDLISTMSTLLWASYVVDIPELISRYENNSEASLENNSKLMRCETWAGVLTNVWRLSCLCSLRWRIRFRRIWNELLTSIGALEADEGVDSGEYG